MDLNNSRRLHTHGERGLLQRVRSACRRIVLAVIVRRDGVGTYAEAMLVMPLGVAVQRATTICLHLYCRWILRIT